MKKPRRPSNKPRVIPGRADSFLGDMKKVPKQSWHVKPNPALKRIA